MSLLQRLGVTIGKDNKTSKIFEELFPSFLDIPYTKPTDFVTQYWKKFKGLGLTNNSTNGKIFELILACLLIRENLLPLYLSAKVAFVPNVKYDLMLFSEERGPICFSAKTSLRERYKQADLEAIALKYVHRKSLCYLLTLDEKEAISVNNKIKSGDVIGLDKVIYVLSNELNSLIKELKKVNFSKPPTIEVITASQIITSLSINSE